MNHSVPKRVQAHRRPLTNASGRIQNSVESGFAAKAAQRPDITQNHRTKGDDQAQAEGADEGRAKDDSVHQRQARHHANRVAVAAIEPRAKRNQLRNDRGVESSQAQEETQSHKTHFVIAAV